MLASETGSGKSIAYLLPLLLDLKLSEHDDHRRRAPPKRAINPRALILAPTHELSRQLASFAKSLLHVSKLRVLYAGFFAQKINPCATLISRAWKFSAQVIIDDVDNNVQFFLTIFVTKLWRYTTNIFQ
jgi:hypothetical protein